MGANCQESPLSNAVQVLHNDIVPPGFPQNIFATTTGNQITVNWDAPEDWDLAGYKVLVGEQPGGPYMQAHSGILALTAKEWTFQGQSGRTFFIILKSLDAAGNESSPSAELQISIP